MGLYRPQATGKEHPVAEVVTLAGSLSARSRSTAVLGYVREQLAARDVAVRHIALQGLPAEDVLYARADATPIRDAIRQIELADALVVATPIYKAAYSGALKAFLDLLPQRILERKVVLPIATGGSPHHLLAIDYALKPVLSALGAQHVLSGVYLLDAHIQLGEDGRADFEPLSLARLDASLDALAAALPLARAALA
ncbi:NADPH-dependent FMN reductase [Chloroflexia bacterium SDU3-3]|nr:NADPH-dependent FMN reductase [Chloroflexia bacterium SDU3-3]